MKMTENQTVYAEKAVLAGLFDGRSDQEENLAMEELEQLSETAGAIVTGQMTQLRSKPDMSLLFGSGKVDELKGLANALRANVIIFNNELSPAQVRNLEKRLDIKVIDRTELILDIFATHAKSTQARLQVEVAQLEYLLPRMKGMWTHLSRIQGGFGIGQRGPGETQIEEDRRMARDKISKLKHDLREIEERKIREVVKRAENFTVSLIGYTNAGKSTIMNALTDSDVLVQNKLFSTLDTKTHTWKLKNGQKVLLSDTVGFIRNLPHHLVASFHATLEEANQADLLIHVVDASHPCAQIQIDAVNEVMRELKIDAKERLTVFNKIDAVDDDIEFTILKRKHPEAILISAKNGTGLDAIDAAVEESVSRKHTLVKLKIHVSNGKVLAYIANKGRISSKTLKGNYMHLEALLGKRDLVIVNSMIANSKE